MSVPSARPITVNFERLLPVPVPVVFQKAVPLRWLCLLDSYFWCRLPALASQAPANRGIRMGSTKDLFSPGPHDQYLADSDLAKDTKKTQKR